MVACMRAPLPGVPAAVPKVKPMPPPAAAISMLTLVIPESAKNECSPGLLKVIVPWLAGSGITMPGKFNPLRIYCIVYQMQVSIIAIECKVVAFP